MWKLLRRMWAPKTIEVKPAENSIGILAKRHGLDRRSFDRVRLPHVKRDIFPTVYCGDELYSIENLGDGGVCLVDVNSTLTLPEEAELTLHFHWASFQEVVLCRMVGHSQKVYRHIQFLHSSERFKRLIRHLVRVGSVGAGLRPLMADPHGPAQLTSAELLIGREGDSLLLYSGGDLKAEITYLNQTVQFFQSRPPRCLPFPGRPDSVTANSAQVAEALLILENIERPPDSVTDLIRWMLQPVKAKMTIGGST